jgi:hypothetical protein
LLFGPFDLRCINQEGIHAVENIRDIIPNMFQSPIAWRLSYLDILALTSYIFKVVVRTPQGASPHETNMVSCGINT